MWLLAAAPGIRRRDGLAGSSRRATKAAPEPAAGRLHAPRFCIIDLQRDGGSSPDKKLSAEERLQRYDLMINQGVCRVLEKTSPGRVDATIPGAEASRYRPKSTSQTDLGPGKPFPGTTGQSQSQRRGNNGHDRRSTD